MNRWLFLIIALGAMALGACGSGEGRLAVQDAWARPTGAGNNGAVYLLITNGGSADDALVGASTDLARAVEIHEVMPVEEDAEGGMEHEGMDMDAMQMRPVNRLAVPAGEEILFEPGSYHVMLVDLQRDLVEGETFMVTLHFEGAGVIEVEVMVGEQ